MDHDEIKKLLELIEDTDITELEVEREGTRVKIRREKFIQPQEVLSVVPASSADAAGVSRVDAPPETNSVSITSPIVGIFHRSPSPEAPPFVEIGSLVRKGQVLCIVEAMKLMNEIESDTDGRIAQVLIENGQPVEYGEPLFIIEPA